MSNIGPGKPLWHFWHPCRPGAGKANDQNIYGIISTALFDKCPSTFRKWWKSHEIQSQWCLNDFRPTQLFEMFALFCFHKIPITATLFLGLFNGQGTGLNLLHLPKPTKLLACFNIALQLNFTAVYCFVSQCQSYICPEKWKSSETNGWSRSIAVQYLALSQTGQVGTILDLVTKWSRKLLISKARRAACWPCKCFLQFVNVINPKRTGILTGPVELHNVAPVWSDFKLSRFWPSPRPSIFRSMLLQRPRDHWAPCW